MNYLVAIAFFVVFCVSVTYASAAPFDLLVNAKLEQYQIELGQKPVVFGTVTDGVLRPASGVDVKITFGANSATTTTDSDGKFRIEFPEQTYPGIFSVNVFAKQDQKKGFGGATLRISKQITTFGDLYYDSRLANLTEHRNDPYGSLKMKNYEKFLNDKSKAYQKQMDIESKKIDLQEKKNAANKALNQTISERAPGPGSFSGYKYDKYISELNPSVRDDITSQINYTKKTIEEAKAAMKKILDSGGTKEEAKKTYFEKITTKRGSLEKIADLNGTENHSKIKERSEKSANKVKGLVAKHYK